MDIILNEKSLDGQFTYENFCKYMQQEVIPSLRLLEENDCSVYKEYGTYKRKITSEYFLVDFLKMQGDPVINEFKVYLHKLSGSIPYWNDSVWTREDVQYRCAIKEIPNCITETYERGGILFSFSHRDFDAPFLELLRDGKTCTIGNADKLVILKQHLNDAGIIQVWDKNSFCIGDLGYKFEIRYNEKNHKVPHFHVSNTNYSISLSIPDMDVLAGELPSGMENKIRSWGLRNIQHIVELWNKIHSDNMVSI